MLRMYGLITYHGTPKTMQHEGFNPYKDGLYPLKMRLVIKKETMARGTRGNGLVNIQPFYIISTKKTSTWWFQPI